MDDTDARLIALLKQNARLPVATLARSLGLARSTVQARLDRLERSGAIAGYAVRLGHGARPSEIRATVLLTLDPRATATVLARLKAMGAVETVHTASGRFDLVLGLATGSTAELDDTLDRIGAIDGVRGSESLIHLATKVDRR